MNWDALGAIGEIIGAVAVIATLYYLSLQIKINSNEISKSADVQRAQSTHNTNALYIKVWQPLMQDSELASIYLKGINDELLDDVERLRFCVYINTFLALIEAAYTQIEADTSFAELDEVAALFGLMRPYMNKILNSTVGDNWLKEEAPSLFTKEFLRDLHQSRIQ
jgi:hypothetical protein